MTATRKLFLFVGIPLVLAFAAVGIWALQGRNSVGTTENSASNAQTTTSCDQIQSPVDVTLATAVLYPGQTRGGDYKPHGGFRFDGLKNDDVTVKVPLDAKVTSGSRYIEQGEVQYMFDLKSDCGLEYRFDHLKTLSAKFQAIADKLPAAKVDDSRTTAVSPEVAVTAGEVIATAVGFEVGDNGPNVSVDFGVYDKRQKNQSSEDTAWVATHREDGDQAIYAVCWFDLLPVTDAAIVKALPASGGDATSDYCN